MEGERERYRERENKERGREREREMRRVVRKETLSIASPPLAPSRKDVAPDFIALATFLP